MPAPTEVLQTTVRDFCTAPQPLVLSVRVALEYLPIAVRVVGGLNKDGERVGFFAHPGSGETPSEYFSSWVEVVAGGFAALLRDLEQLQHRFPDVPRELAPTIAPLPAFDRRGDPAAAFVAYIERAAETLREVVDQVVVATCIDDEESAEIRAALQRFGRMLGSGRVKLILLDASTEALFAPGTVAFDRIRQGTLLNVDSDASAAFRDFARFDGERILMADGPSNVEPFLSLLPDGSTVRIAAPYRGRAAFEDEVWVGLERTLGIRRPGPRASLDDLARALEEAAGSRSAAPLVVAIDARPSMTPKFLAQWIEEAAAAVCSARTKLVLLEDPVQRARPHLTAKPVPFRETTFVLDVAGLHSVVTDLVHKVDGTKRERMTGYLAMAGIAMSHLKFQQGLELLQKAKPFAETLDDRVLVALQEGQALYFSGEFVRAAGVYENAIELASRADEPVSPAQFGALLGGLANARLRLRDFEDAIALYEAAADMARKFGNLALGIGLDAWRGEAHRRAGNGEAAEHVWARAYDEASTLGPDLEDASAPLRAELLERRSRLRRDLGDTSSADRLHREAAEMVDPVFVPVEP